MNTFQNYKTSTGTCITPPAPIPKHLCVPAPATLNYYRKSSLGNLNNLCLRRAFSLACKRIDDLEALLKKHNLTIP